MAVSAYKQGKLKKNPLLGSSLAVDPNRELERKNFMALHGEAKEVAGEGRSGMVKRLADRYQKFGAPIASAMEGMASERSRLSGIDTSAERMTANKSMVSAERGVAAGKRWLTGDGFKKFDAYDSDQQKELEDARVAQYGHKGKQFQWKRKLRHGKKYFADELKKRKGKYETLSAANSARLGKIDTLTSQYNEKKGLLDKRANQYNMFLGA